MNNDDRAKFEAQEREIHRLRELIESEGTRTATLAVEYLRRATNAEAALASAQAASAEPVAPATPSSKWHATGEPDPHGKRYDCERAALAMGDLTDDELANGAFMNYDVRPSWQELIDGKAHSPIAWMTAVKDRIRWLSRSLEAALTTPAPAVAPAAVTDERAWLVEWNLHGYGPQWWGFNYEPGKRGMWCSDANNAIRFSRREDAERMRLHIIDATGMKGYHDYERSVSVTEHEWPALATRTPEPAAVTSEQKPLDDARLQRLFGDAIEGALAFGFQGSNQPPDGHWLARFWNIGNAERSRTPEPQAEQGAYSYASTQATECAGCGKRKHTPLRIDAMGGYVCLTCIDQKLGTLLGEFGYPQSELDANTLGVALEKLVNDALDAGMVFSVTRRSVPPLAMGRHVAEVSVWPARGAE